MLEKMFGVPLVSKLRAMLLTEADYNAMNKEVYGVRCFNRLKKHRLVLKDILSEKNCTADDRGLKKLCSTTLSTSSATASVNASNYYDHVLHTMALLIF